MPARGAMGLIRSPPNNESTGGMGNLLGKRAAIAALSAMLCGSALATDAAARSDAQPLDAAFVQRDVGEEVSAFTIGWMHKTGWRPFSDELSVYGELSLSRWAAHAYHPTDSGPLV